MEEKEDVVKEETKEPEVKEPEKKGTSKILLLLLVIALSSFAAWFFALGGKQLLMDEKEEPNIEEKQDKKEEEQPEEKQEEQEEKQDNNKVSLNEDKKKELYEIVDYFITNNTSAKTKIVISELSNQELLYATLRLRNSAFDEEVSEDTLKIIVKNLFGNVSFKNETIKCKICGRDLYSYSSSNKNYVKSNNHPGHGGGQIVDKSIYYESAEKDEAKGTITVKYKVVYSQFVDDLYSPPENYYPTITDMKNKTNGFYSNSVDQSSSITFDSVYKEFCDKIPYTKAIFKVEGANYYLQTIELQ